MTNAVWPYTIGDFDVHRGAVIYAVIFSLIVGFGTYFLSKEIAAKAEARVIRILKTQGVAVREPVETES
jgi:hypothetical protein